MENAQSLKEGIEFALQQTRKDIIDQMEEEKQQNLPNAITSMQADQFPAFLTVKKLIYMLDGSLSNSFFARAPDGSIIGSSTSTDWHNESKNGAFMINRYLKEDYDYTKKLKSLGKMVIKGEEAETDFRKQFFD